MMREQVHQLAGGEDKRSYDVGRVLARSLKGEATNAKANGRHGIPFVSDKTKPRGTTPGHIAYDSSSSMPL